MYPLIESNYHSKFRRVLCFHCTNRAFIVVPAGIEPTLLEPKSGVITIILWNNVLISNHDAKISQIFEICKSFTTYFQDNMKILQK